MALFFKHTRSVGMPDRVIDCSALGHSGTSGKSRKFRKKRGIQHQYFQGIGVR